MSAYEGIVIGEVHAFGSHEFTAERIKRFATAYDPQSFHVDEEGARDSIFGALCASGWHTASVMMRLLVDYFAASAERARVAGEPALIAGPSPGFDDLKWLKPVYAGDTVAYSGRVTGKRLSRSRPGWGLVTMEIAGTDQAGDAVFAITTHVFVVVA